MLCALVLVSACSDDAPTFQDARPIDAGIDGVAIDADMTNPRPGPVTALAATPMGIELDLAWQNPPDTDLDGILVVASPDPVTFTPTDGMTYTVAQVVGTNQAVVSVAVATALADLPTIPGLGIHFAAWARDSAGQYSAEPATTRGVNNALGTQSGMIQVFQDGTVTVTQQPRSLRLSGTATYDDAGDTMTVQLTVENQAGRVLFNLKGVVDSASQGTVSNPSFPAVGGRPALFYGPQAVAIGGTPARQLDLTGIDGTVNPVVLAMHFVDAPAIVVSDAGDAAQTLDSAGSTVTGTVAMPAQICAKRESRGGALSADARYLYTGTKSAAWVTRTDLTSLTLAQSATLATTNGLGSVTDVALSADGQRLYAVLVDGSHAHGGLANNCGGGEVRLAATSPAAPISDTVIAGGGPTSKVRLVELDPESLDERRRVDLRITSTLGALELLAGNRAAVITRDGEVAVVDLATMTLVDADPGQAGIQNLDLAGELHERITTNRARTSFSVAVSVEAGYRIDTIDSATLARTSVDLAEDSPNRQRVVGLHRTSDDKLYVLYRYESKGPSGGLLVTIDGAQQTTTDPESNRIDGLAFSPDERTYYIVYGNEIRAYDRATHTELDTDGDAGNGITPLPLPDTSKAHGLHLVTPF